MKFNQQARAALILFKVAYKGDNLKIVLAQQSVSSQVKAWVYGSCRYYDQLLFIVTGLYKKPLRQDLLLVESLLLIGIYQCLYSKMPLAVSVAETVAACEPLKLVKFKGLVNGLLRNFLRNKSTIIASFNDISKYSHNKFLLNLLKTNWPDDWLNIIAANNSSSAIHLRLRNFVKDYQLKGEIWRSSPLVDGGIVLTETPNINNIDLANNFSIQDCGAQVLGNYLQTIKANNILDAGSAPGGKAVLLADKYPQANIIAVDKSLARSKVLQNNLAVCNVNNVEVVCADLTKDLFAKQFDLIILDAPCSGSGVISRQPDIKINFNKKLVNSCVQQQQALLNSLWQCLQPGGIMIYITCSILHVEGHLQIIQFLTKNSQAKADYTNNIYGKYILPKEWNNGFYFCKLYKEGISH